MIGLETGVIKESVSFHIPQTQLFFKETKNIAEPVYHFAFNIPFNKAEKVEVWLKSSIELVWQDDYKSCIAEFVNWNVCSLYFFDPAGNIVEFNGRRDLDDFTEESFLSKHIRNISEIGLVLPKIYFEEEIKQIMEHHQLSCFAC